LSILRSLEGIAVPGSWIELVGFGGTVFTIAAYSMRTILPLRIAGILSSVFFISYALLIQSWPVLATELVILPLNVVRLYQILTLIKKVDEAADTDKLSAEWLQPFGRDRKYKAGDVLFRAGDAAQNMLMLQAGRFELVEAGKVLTQGELVGEMGFLSPGNRRTMTLICVEDGTVSQVSYLDLKQLYFSNPKFAFYLLRLVSERMFENAERARKENVAAAT
jgi:CRP/FNR family transcriptional regulator, cyclic AMP receptor protein